MRSINYYFYITLAEIITNAAQSGSGVNIINVGRVNTHLVMLVWLTLPSVFIIAVNNV